MPELFTHKETEQSKISEFECEHRKGNWQMLQLPRNRNENSGKSGTGIYISASWSSRTQLYPFMLRP